MTQRTGAGAAVRRGTPDMLDADRPPLDIGWRVLAGPDARLAGLAALFLGRADRAERLAALLDGLPMHRDGPVDLFAVIDRLGVEQDAICAAMAEDTATTLEGFTAKAQVILKAGNVVRDDKLEAGTAERLAWSLCRDILEVAECVAEPRGG
jgi:hypothetical protein